MTSEMANDLPERHSASVGSIVSCRIESASAWSRWSEGAPWHELRAALGRAIGSWLDALDLRVIVRFEWHADRADGWPDASLCRLLFDEHDAVFVRLPPPETSTKAELVARLARGVFDARAFLVTPMVARRLRLAEGAEAGSDRWQLARELVERGLRPQRAWQADRDPQAAVTDLPYDQVIDQDAIALRVDVANAGALDKQPADTQPLHELFELLADGLFYELGVMLPNVEVASDAALPAGAIRIRVNDMPLPTAEGLPAGDMLINDTPDRLVRLGVEGARPATNPANGNPCAMAVASDANRTAVEKAGLTAWGPAGYLVLLLAAAVRRHAGAYWTREATDAAMFLLRDVFPELIDAADRIDRVLLTQVLRSLLDEEISVRDLPTILEAMLAVDSVLALDQRNLIAFLSPAGNFVLSRRAKTVSELGVEEWAGCVRIRLARYLSHKITRGQWTLDAYVLDPAIEAEIESAAEPAGAGAASPLHTPAGYLRLFKAMSAEIGDRGPSSAKPMILTTLSVRRPLRDLIRRDFPDATVLCYQELLPEIHTQPTAKIGWVD